MRNRPKMPPKPAPKPSKKAPPMKPYNVKNGRMYNGSGNG